VNTPAILATALACSALGPTSAVQDVNPQVAAETTSGRPAFRAATEMVALNVTVVDSHEQDVTGLTSQDFAVYDDGVPQQLNFFGSGDVPIDLAVVIDTSVSMRQRLPVVQRAAIRFVRVLRPIDRGAVIAFADRMRFLQPLTHDVGLLERAIAGTKAGGDTALYSTLYVLLGELAKAGRDAREVRRPAIVVLTDGADTASVVTYEDVVELVRRTGVAVYPISIASSNSPGSLQNEGKDRTLNPIDEDLKRLAKESGGQAFFPLRLDELDRVYARVARELSTQYSLAYVPKRPSHGGVFHNLLVQVISRGDAFPRTRLGYVAGQQDYP
jgi:Ca-activated chloride channel family protein